MAGKIVDRTGEIFGDLLVLGQARKERTETGKTLNVYWICLCRCGMICEYRYSALWRGAIKSCGCRGELYKSNWPKKEREMREFYSRNKKKARQRGFVEYPDFKEWANIISKPCGICGKLPEIRIRKGNRGKKIQIECNQIDRIDNTKGYIFDNMQACCEMCNLGKLDWTQQDYIEHCISVADFWKAKIIR